MRRQKGFTLIELLIVVAIIGIIAAIAIPNLLNALNRGRQKRTMADMRSIGTAIESYQVDNNFYPVAADATTMRPFIEPTYIKKAPPNDGWNRGLYINSTQQHYTIYSTGRAGTGVPNSNGQTTDFNEAIAFSDGSFVEWPEGTQQ